MQGSLGFQKHFTYHARLIGARGTWQEKGWGQELLLLQGGRAGLERDFGPQPLVLFPLLGWGVKG